MRQSWLPVVALLLVSGVNSATPVQGADWADEQTHGIFVFRADFPLRDLAGHVEELGDLQKDIEATLDLKCRPQPIEVHLFRTRWGYNRYVRREVPVGVGRPALFIAGNGVGRVYATAGRELDVDLRHEATHALLHNALPYVPLWLDEGFAEYFEVSAAARVNGSPHWRALQFASRTGWRPNLALLEAKRQLSEMDGRDYRDAWGWVHFMLHGPTEARAALDEFLVTIPTGREPTPLSLSLRQRIPDLDRAIIQHFR